MKKLDENIVRLKTLMDIESSINEATFKAPLAGSLYVTSPFGQKRSYETHPGVDLRAKSGTQILSPADGVVVLADPNNNPKCGGTIDVKFEGGFWGRFCHVKQIYKKKGDPVSQGDVLGLSGGDATDPGRGNSKNAHIHFTLKKDGKLVNPMDYIDKAQISSKSDTGLLGSYFNKSSLLTFLKKLFPFLFEQYSFPADISQDGTDYILSRRNAKIKSPVGGTIVNYNPGNSCGGSYNFISIEHLIDNKKYYLLFCGVDEVRVSNGTRVSIGKEIGTTGDRAVRISLYDNRGNRINISKFIENNSQTKGSTEQNQKVDRNKFSLGNKTTPNRKTFVGKPEVKRKDKDTFTKITQTKPNRKTFVGEPVVKRKDKDTFSKVQENLNRIKKLL